MVSFVGKQRERESQGWMVSALKEKEKLFHSRLAFYSHNETTHSYSPATPTCVIILSSQFEVIYSPYEDDGRRLIEAKVCALRSDLYGTY